MRAVKIAKIAVLAIVAIAVFGWIIMSLWNWIIPPITGWHPITYWQALGLFVLSKILFGGFRGHGPHWRRRMLRRYAEMTPEEREKFREAMRDRYCRRADEGPTPASSKA